MKMKTKSKIIGNVAIYSVLCLGGFVMLYPLIFMLLASFFSPIEYLSAELTLFPIAKEPTLKNIFFFLDGANFEGMGVYLKNSVLRTVVYVIGTVLSTSLCGYAFARLRFKFKNFIFFGLLFFSMMPSTMSLIPQYLMYAKWPTLSGNGILNTWLVYYIGLPGINIMGTFFVKQFIETIPDSIDQAAKIDGAGTLRIIFEVIMPLMRPAIAYISITTALSIWNDWSTGFFFTDDQELQMLPSMIAKLSTASSSAVPDYPQILSLGLVMTVPSLIIYAIFQKDIVECVATAGLKD